MFTLAAILALAVQATPQAPSAVGSLVGCASDAANQRIPGVTVVATTGRVHRTAITDAGGCFELKDLPIGSYRVTAHLPGFYNVTRDGVKIAGGSVARLDYAMQLSPICECVVGAPNTNLAEQWDHAEAVLHVRLSDPKSQATTPVGYYRHLATVIDPLKEPARPLRTPVFVLQHQWGEDPAPYDVDQEAVMFLRSSGSGGFVIASDNPASGNPMVFLILDGHIQGAPPGFSRYVGKPLAPFLDELRALSRGK